MTVRILQGHALDQLATLEANSVHCCITSPPYYGLRDYQLPPQVWDDPGRCDHEWRNEPKSSQRLRNGEGSSTLSSPQAVPVTLHPPQDAFCQHCGCWRGSIGLEPHPDLYVRHLVQVMATVWRVLRDDGTLWLNLASGYEDKQLLGLEWRVAFALQAAGWYLRSAITICKMNPMPESVQGSMWTRHRVRVESHRTQTQGYAQAGGHRDKRHGNLEDQPTTDWTDCPGCPKCSANDGLVLRMSAGRPTQATEMMFLLTKRGTYYFDSEAVREPASPQKPWAASSNGGLKAALVRADGGVLGQPALESGRNMRNWFAVSSEPYPNAHFATFGTRWITPAVQAGTSEWGCCAICGAPWVRVIDRSPSLWPERKAAGETMRHGINGAAASAAGDFAQRQTKTLGWRRSCTHDTPVVPCTVLDPFAGAMTTGLLAARLGRDAILIELNPEYVAMGRKRLQTDAPLLYEEVS